MVFLGIKKVVVGTEAIKISEGMQPKTLIVQNLSASDIYLTSDPHSPITEGVKIDANGGSYSNDFAKKEYYLLSASSGLDVRVEEN